jgi:tetratricopeptide (TPR) repeat protein
MDGPTGNGQPQRRYEAFISYCRRDLRQAEWLQRAIEDWRMPGRLAGRDSARGPVPARFRTVFLDRSELRAAPDLSVELAAALDASDWLIVLCTPQAAASQWVNREVEMMQASGRGDRILAALFDGNETSAFPPALRAGASGRLSPLAADFRPGHEGRRLALLKLVAAMAGVGLGDLLDRHEARRRRRLTAVAGASLAGMALFAGISIYALNARAEAERQRQKADALVETLVTDLRAAVKPLGSLAVLDRINEAALGFFRGQSLESMEDSALAQRARLLTSMGADDMARGRMPLARVQFEEAWRTTAQRLAAAPDDPGRIFDHAQSSFWRGYVAFEEGEVVAARQSFEDYARLAEQLVAADPDDGRWQMEAGHAAINLGMLALRELGEAEAAERAFRRALGHYRRAVALSPEPGPLLADLANGLGWLADSLRAQEEWAEARALRQEQLQLAERQLLQRPQDRDLRMERATALLALGRIAADSGDPTGALAILARAEADARALAESDPDNSIAGRQLRVTRLFQARSALLLPPEVRPPAAQVAGWIGRCGDTGSEPAGLEVARFCLLVLARLRAAEGRNAEALALAGREPDSRGTRPSDVFGIDLGRETAAVRRLAAG